jgi:hypothetical protein
VLVPKVFIAASPVVFNIPAQPEFVIVDAVRRFMYFNCTDLGQTLQSIG